MKDIKIEKAFGVEDMFAQKVRNGFVAKSPEEMAIEYAKEVVEVSVLGSEDTYAEFYKEDLTLTEALEVLEMNNSRIVEIPGYMADLIKDKVGYVISSVKEAFFNGSSIGVKPVQF